MAQPASDEATPLEDPKPTPPTPEPPAPRPRYIPEWTPADHVERLFYADRKHRVERVARRCLHLEPSTEVQVEYVSKAYWHLNPKVFKHTLKVTTLNKQFHFTVKCHAGHGHDIASQIATMDCVRQRTNVFLVPKVIAHDTSDDNELGRSWMMREYIPGDKLANRWRALSMDQKEAVAQDLGRYFAQLYRIRFNKIGSLAYDKGDNPTTPALRQFAVYWLELWCCLWLWLLRLFSAIINLVTAFSRPPHLASPSFSNKIVVGKDSFITDPGLPTGPFTNAHDWLQARLQQNIRHNLAAGDDCGFCPLIECGIISESIRWGEYIRKRTCFRVKERFTTLNHPIDESRIIISDDGTVATLLGWDDISVCPSWAVAGFPDALLSRENRIALSFEESIDYLSVPAHLDRAAALEAYAETMTHLASTKSSVGGPNYPFEVHHCLRRYWEHLESYEKTRLRELFLGTMSGLAPDWNRVHSRRQTDRTITKSVRVLMDHTLSPPYFSQFEEQLDTASWDDTASERSWPSDEDTVFGSSDSDDNEDL